jgi:hypothetical protein
VVGYSFFRGGNNLIVSDFTEAEYYQFYLNFKDICLHGYQNKSDKKGVIAVKIVGINTS